jgi:hypothetical protein
MRAVSCPHHGDEVLDLIRGRLDDCAATEAAQHLESCTHCASWYEQTFSGPAYSAVDRAVGSAVRATELPRRSRRRWLAAAAAVVLVAGGYALLERADTVAPGPAVPTDVVVSLDFEDESLLESDTVVLVDEPAEQVVEHATDTEGDVLFASDLEDGGLGSWKIHT